MGAPSDFHLFAQLKDYLRGQKFEDDEAIKAAVRSCIRQCDPDFFKTDLLAGKRVGTSMSRAMGIILRNKFLLF
jgi:hypothetical protein